MQSTRGHSAVVGWHSLLSPWCDKRFLCIDSSTTTLSPLVGCFTILHTVLVHMCNGIPKSFTVVVIKQPAFTHLQSGCGWIHWYSYLYSCWTSCNCLLQFSNMRYLYSLSISICCVMWYATADLHVTIPVFIIVCPLSAYKGIPFSFKKWNIIFYMRGIWTGKSIKANVVKKFILKCTFPPIKNTVPTP